MGHPAGTLTEHRRVGPRRTAHGPERQRAPYYRPAFPTPRLLARQQSNDLQARPRQLHRRLAGCIDGAEIGARVQEQFDAFRVAARGRPVQGPPVSVWVTLVRGRAVPLEELLELHRRKLWRVAAVSGAA